MRGNLVSCSCSFVYNLVPFITVRYRIYCSSEKLTGIFELLVFCYIFSYLNVYIRSDLFSRRILYACFLNNSVIVTGDETIVGYCYRQWNDEPCLSNVCHSWLKRLVLQALSCGLGIYFLGIVFCSALQTRVGFLPWQKPGQWKKR